MKHINRWLLTVAALLSSMVVRAEIILTQDDGLLSNTETNQYVYESPVLKFTEETATIVFTFLESYTETSSLYDPNGYPFIALAEFYLYDKEGNEVELTAENFSTNAQERSEGPIEYICDGNLTTYFHSTWTAGASDYHRIFVALPDGKKLTEFSFKYITRYTSQCVPKKIQINAEYETLPSSPLELIDGVFYNIDLQNSTATVVSNNTEYTGSITIPSKVIYENVVYRVTQIASSAFRDCSSLVSITIPSSMTSIGNWAFSGCNSLTTIICNAVTPPSLGLYCFTGSTPIYVPASSVDAYKVADEWSDFYVQPIPTEIINGTCGDYLTWRFTDEGELNIEGTGDMYNFYADRPAPWSYYETSITSVIIEQGVTSIGVWAFSDCVGLISVNIPESVTSIGDFAFYECNSLTSVNISEDSKLTNIGTCAFWGCSSLTSITIPEGVTSIENQAFYGCSSLTTITIPESVTSIENLAFSHCSSLTSMTVFEGNTVYDSRSGCNAIIETATNTLVSGCAATIIPENVKSIERGAFNGCSGLTSITIPESVTSIGDVAFRGCSSLTSINIPEGVTSIGDYAFYDCTSLTSINIPEGVTSIGDYAFYDCTSLTAVHITDIAAWCNLGFSGANFNPLYYANNLYLNGELVTELTIPEGVTSIGDCVFSGCIYLTSISLPESVTNIGHGAFYNCSSLTDINIPEGVANIGDWTFYCCSSLTDINIPEGVTGIGDGAFMYSSLTSISIPESVTSIESSAFNGCSRLTSINVSESNTVYDSREECNAIIETSNNTLILACKSTTIPKSVTSIGDGAFKYSSLTSIIIPENVTSIGDYAFYGSSIHSSIICKAMIPPIVGTDAFMYIDSSIPVYVPASSVEVYKAADGWSEFTNIQPILATSLALDVTEVTLTPNETLTLNAILQPVDFVESELTWISSNETIATVSAEGVVTAIDEGEVVITVMTTDGSNLSATCAITVRVKNSIYFEDATVYDNNTIDLPLLMKNEDDITAVQFDVYLPEGVTLKKTNTGQYNITFNEERADNSTHTLSSALQADGAIRVICYSFDSELFLGNEGAIFNFPLEVAEIEEGDYTIGIKNIVLTESSGKKYKLTSMSSTLHVLNIVPGDCNKDQIVDAADIVILANYILGYPVDVFSLAAADYNKDEEIDVADIVGIANYILGGNIAAAREFTREVMNMKPADTGHSFEFLATVLEKEKTKSLSLDLADPTESFTAFQCDLYLPEGISINENARGKYDFSFNDERTDASRHTLSGSQQTDGSVRILCYSMGSEVFMGEDGTLINIPLTVDESLESGEYDFSIANTVLIYKDGRKVGPLTYHGIISVGSTSIENTQLTRDDTETFIYDLQGRRIANPCKGIYIVNGKKVQIK